MSKHTSTPAPRDTWTENVYVLAQTDEPHLPTPDRDDNPYYPVLTEWDIDSPEVVDAEFDPDADSDGYPAY